MTKKLNSQGFGIVEQLIIIVVLVLIIAAGWFVIKNHSSTADKAQGTSKSITVLGEKLSRTNCDMVKSLVREDLSGDICYTGKFSVNGEAITYISVGQSESFRANLDKTCTLDCGGSIPLPSHDNIVRANGSVEYASNDWASQAEPSIDYLTGCGTGKFFQLDSFKDQGKLVKNNGKIAVAVSLKDANISDDYGNRCSINAKLISYTANAGQLIQQLDVHYQLSDINSCEQQSKPEDCYAAQAVMRNDLQLCDKAVDRQYPQSGADYCIESLAKRRLDVNLCSQLKESADICRKDTLELRDVFTGKVNVH